MTLSWKKYGNTHQHQRLVNIQNMSRHKVFLSDQRVSETESSLLDSIQKRGGGGQMKRRMTEAKTGSGEERECLKILQSETIIVLRRLYPSSSTRPGETRSNMNSPKSLTFTLSIWVTSHFFSNIAKTWPVGLRLKRALNRDLEIRHANFGCQKWAAQSRNRPGPWGWETGKDTLQLMSQDKDNFFVVFTFLQNLNI